MGSAVRHSAPNVPDFMDLPSELKEAIMVKVEAQQGILAAAKMRLLSKACRSAFDTYKGRQACLILQAKGIYHFQKVCSMLSQMHSLYILATKVDTDFSPLSSLGQLTSLSLSPIWGANQRPVHQPSLSMGILPASLKRLDLCPVTTRDLDRLHLPCLTWLSLKVEDVPRGMEFLPQLPHLEELYVTSVGHYPHCRLEEVFAGPLESLHALRKVKLSNGLLFGRPLTFDWQSPPALKELCLSKMTVDSYYLGLLSNELPCIIAFSLDCCEIEWTTSREEVELEQKTMKMLQSLKLFSSGRGFLLLADEDLLELHLAGTPFTRKHFNGNPVIADKSLDLESSLQRFTSLTRLVIDGCELGLGLTRQTLGPIAELVVIDSRHPESIICEADALGSLQSLHLEAQSGLLFGSCEYPYHKHLNEYKDDSEERKSELQMVATALLSLPQLGRISGNCRLLDEYLAKHLSKWKHCLVSSRVLNVPHRKGVRNSSTWIKT